MHLVRDLQRLGLLYHPEKLVREIFLLLYLLRVAMRLLTGHGELKLRVHGHLHHHAPLHGSTKGKAVLGSLVGGLEGEAGLLLSAWRSSLHLFNIL